MKSYSEFLSDAWNPPFRPLPGSGKTPMAKAREKAKTNPNVDTEKVRTSPKRFAEPFNTSSTNDYDVESSSDKKGNPVYTFKSKNSPFEVSYTGIGPNHFVQNTRNNDANRPDLTSAERIKLGRDMTRYKTNVARAVKPGVKITSQPTTDRRASLNTKYQGLSPKDEKGNQHGTGRNLSPKQKANKATPLRPTSHQGSVIDPNYD